MKFEYSKFAVVATTILAIGAASAEDMDRPSGWKIGERMTLKPYVALSAAYDSNVDGRKDGSDDVLWIVNPGLGLEYKAENWHILAAAYYQFHAYSKGGNANRNNNHTFGQNIVFDWTNANPGEKGWAFALSESFKQVNEVEDMSLDGGRNYSRDRRELTVAGAIQRRFGKGFHADINGGYYWLDYFQNNNQYMGNGLYGWDRWSAGAEIGYAPSPWTDILVVGGYQNYSQENRDNNYYWDHKDYRRSSQTDSWTVQAGLGSFATEKITYRVLAGWSNYQYKESGSNSNGFTYTVLGSWTINDYWKTMLMANSAYQPTEREFGSSQRVDSVSWGIAHSMVRGKLNGTFDVAYRRETREHQAVGSYDYDLDILTFRLGFTYTLNRYFALFTNYEYRASMSSGGKDSYDYNRFRATLGVKLTY